MLQHQKISTVQSSAVHTDETTEESSYTERRLAAQFMTHDVTERYLYHLLMFLVGTNFSMFTEGDSGMTYDELTSTPRSLVLYLQSLSALLCVFASPSPENHLYKQTL